MKPKVKICGITNLIDAKNALNLGADYIGFINIEYSPRFQNIEEIEEISRNLDDNERARIVLLTEESSVDAIVNHCSRLGTKNIQAYTNLDNSDLNRLRSLGFKVLRPVRVASYEDLTEIDTVKESSDIVILDTKSADSELLGGTGKVFDWNIFLKAKNSYDINLALAGGLNSDNLSEAIKLTQPYMIDLSSGVESQTGIKSLAKLKAVFGLLQTA